MYIFKQKLIMEVPFIKNKQINKHPFGPFWLNLLRFESGPGLIMEKSTK